MKKERRGRKFFDGKYNKPQFDRRLKKYFRSNYTIYGFLREYGISRQSFYRYLYKNPKMKTFVYEHKKVNEDMAIRHREEVLQWMTENPDKSHIDFYLRDIEIPNVDLTLCSINTYI